MASKDKKREKIPLCLRLRSGDEDFFPPFLIVFFFFWTDVCIVVKVHPPDDVGAVRLRWRGRRLRNISIKDLQQDVKLPKRLPHLAGHGLTFENKGFYRHQLTVTRHALVEPEENQILTVIKLSHDTVSKLTHRSWRDISTPTDWVGVSILLLITVAKFFNTNLNELQAVLTYLVIKIGPHKCANHEVIDNKLNLHFKFTLQEVGYSWK